VLLHGGGVRDVMDGSRPLDSRSLEGVVAI
jgi:hypothetical protein